MRATLRLLRPKRTGELTDNEWSSLVDALYSLIWETRREAAVLARRFFDGQQARFSDQSPTSINLPSYRREWLEESLQPQRARLVVEDTPEGVLTEVSEIAMKDTEDAGRKTLMRAVENSTVAMGWARVLTGRENCAFCVMLASRGAVYRSEESAGGTNSRTFHKGCDCKVVPVFDPDNWPGLEASREAERIYRDGINGARGQREVLRKLRQYLNENPSVIDDARAV